MRWIRSHDAEFVDVGLQCWGVGVVPVNLQIHGQSKQLPGLVLTDEAGACRKLTDDKGQFHNNDYEIESAVQLLTQSGYLDAHDRLRCLFADGQSHWFNLNELLESTEEIDRFVLPPEQWRQVAPINSQDVLHNMQ